MGTADKEFLDLLKAGAPCVVIQHDSEFWHGKVVSSRLDADRLVVEVEAYDAEIKYLQGRILFSTRPFGPETVLRPLRADCVVYPDTPSIRTLIELYLRAAYAASRGFFSDAPGGWGSG